ncbi:MAG: hypothetical protein EOM20_06115 [Spartobacteria bacterium]|nr:hypothetical protein [Spartobacteria bacterium]
MLEVDMRTRWSMLVVVGVFFLPCFVFANLLMNPGFEDGTGADVIDHWSRNNEFFRETWAAQSGTYGVAMYGWTSGGFISQDIQCTGNSNYTFTVSGYKDAGFDLAAFGVELKLEFFSDLGGSVMLGAVTTRITSAAAAWTEFTVSGAAPWETVLVRPVVAFGGTASAGAFKWDNAVLTSEPNSSAIRYVSPSGSHTAPYTSWSTAAHSIQAALNACSPGDVVKVTNGTYTLDMFLYVYSNVTLESVNGSGVIVDANHTGRCAYLNPGAVVDGLVFINGLHTSSVNNASGGGLYCNSATIRNCGIFSNACSTVDSNAEGGGVYCTAGSLVENCEISYNALLEGACFGAGVYAEPGVTVRHCRITYNEASASTVFFYYGAACQGGGVFMNGAASIEDTLVAHNVANGAYGSQGASSGQGAGIFCTGTGTVYDCSIVSNRAIGGDGGSLSGSAPRGAGVYAGPSSIVDRCSIRHNLGMGGSLGSGGANDAVGGGIYCNDGSVCNTEIIGNTIQGGPDGMSGGVARGGGVYATYGATLRNVTVAANVAVDSPGPNASWGGGVFLYTASSMHNSILYDNQAANGPDITVDGSGYYYTHCCIKGVAGGAGNITNDPAFRDAAAGDYRLKEDSPCINAGDNSTACGLTDVAGNIRIKRGIVDIGAREAGAYVHVAKNTSPVSPYTNWMTAATNVGDAVAVAEAGDYILVSNGTYHVAGQIWVGSEVTIRGVNGADHVVIDGNGSSRCFYINDPGVVLEGLRITHGFAGLEENTSRGGGVFSSAGGAFFGCVFSGNTAAGGTARGGGLYLASGGLVSNCVFFGNSAEGGILTSYYGNPGYGGGLFSGGHSIVLDSDFVNNTAYGRQGYYGAGGASGGGAYIISNQTLAGCSFSGNHARGGNAGGRTSGTSGLGGGLYMYRSTVIDCIFADNVAEGGYSDSGGWGAAGPGVGGGLYSAESTVERCVVENNTARGAWATGYDGAGNAYGGGIYAYNNAALRNCLIVGNTATGGWFTGVEVYLGGDALGGGLYCVSGTVENCTIAGNNTRFGAGLDGSSNGEEKGGGVYARAPLVNCIVYHNTSTNGGNAFIDAAGSFTYSCITPDPGGVGNITDDPLFIDYPAGDCHLAYGSACIDAGTDLSGFFTDDLEGCTRPVDGDMNGAAAFDIGAYEYDPRETDTDADRLCDYDEVMVYFCNPEQADSDVDGMMDGAEVIAGTSPTNAASFFALEGGAPADYSGDGFVLRWNSVSGRQYTVMRGDAITGEFSAVASDLGATPPINVYTDLTAVVEARCYYKIQVE